MKQFFDDFSKEDIEWLTKYDFEEESDGGYYNIQLDLTLYKYGEEYYALRNEEESTIERFGDDFYLLSGTWWMLFDMDIFKLEMEDGSVYEDDFYIERFRK